MRAKILYFSLMLVSLASYSQQDSQYTQYMYNTMSVNPAYAGSRGVLSAFGLYRTQWVGLDGAPKTANLAVSTPIANSNLGLGVSFVNDQIGPTTENAISADVSYTIPTSETHKLSFGVKGTANLFSIDKEKLSPTINTDPVYMSLNSNNFFSPNVGAGVYYHSGKSYIGLSVPNVLETKRYSGTTASFYKEQMNAYLIAGYVFDLTDNIKFKPALLSKLVQGAPLQVDLSGNFMFNQKFVLGAAYRWDAAASVMAGFQVNNALYIGYAYDKETTALGKYNSGSHEIFLRYELFKKPERVISPRFF